jgi:hypothetical protein
MYRELLRLAATGYMDALLQNCSPAARLHLVVEIDWISFNAAWTTGSGVGPCEKIPRSLRNSEIR